MSFSTAASSLSRRCTIASLRQGTRLSATAFRSYASTTANLITESDVKAQFKKWNDALATLDPAKVAACYAPDAVLLPSVSDSPRTDHESIEAFYRDEFLPKKPQGTIIHSWIRIGDNDLWAQDNGIYEFQMGATNESVKARYTFVYAKDNDGVIKIVHHHSSLMPETMKQAVDKLGLVQSILKSDGP